MMMMRKLIWFRYMMNNNIFKRQYVIETHTSIMMINNGSKNIKCVVSAFT